MGLVEIPVTYDSTYFPKECSISSLGKCNHIEAKLFWFLSQYMWPSSNGPRIKLIDYTDTGLLTVLNDSSTFFGSLYNNVTHISSIPFVIKPERLKYFDFSQIIEDPYEAVPKFYYSSQWPVKAKYVPFSRESVRASLETTFSPLSAELWAFLTLLIAAAQLLSRQRFYRSRKFIAWATVLSAIFFAVLDKYYNINLAAGKIVVPRKPKRFDDFDDLIKRLSLQIAHDEVKLAVNNFKEFIYQSINTSTTGHLNALRLALEKNPAVEISGSVESFCSKVVQRQDLVMLAYASEVELYCDMTCLKSVDTIGGLFPGILTAYPFPKGYDYLTIEKASMFAPALMNYRDILGRRKKPFGGACAGRGFGSKFAATIFNLEGPLALAFSSVGIGFIALLLELFHKTIL